MDVKNRLETFRGEDMKSMAEATLHRLGQLGIVGDKIIENYAFGSEGRVVDPALAVDVAGVEFENPVLFGAGWDKKGRAVRGLYDLGFAGGEVGTVLPFGQYGNEKARLWTINKSHSVGLNRLGFNSLGMDAVDKYLSAAEPLPCPIGINVGRNKIMGNDMAVWAHGQVIQKLHRHAAYIALGISSPNTKDLRALQSKGPLRDLIQGARAAMTEVDHVIPLFLKLDAERSWQEYDDIMEVSVEEHCDGLIEGNTYMASDLKARYGERWVKEAGGLSGADRTYRKLTTSRVHYLYEQAGDKLTIMGVGGVDSTESALQKMRAGASAVQVVTAIRPSRGKVAANIVKGLSEYVAQNNLSSINEIVGIDTKRGVKVA